MADIRDFSPGWSIARLADEFGMDRRTAAKRLREAGVPPSGKRGTNDIYRLADAAPALVSPSGASGSEQVLDPRDLPPMERRAYYQSENERLKVETTTGLLVPAAEVEADYAELVQKSGAVLRHVAGRAGAKTIAEPGAGDQGPGGMRPRPTVDV
ncbi:MULTISPECIES: DUF1441 family protein [Xanthomonas]|uniref:DUF1441 family protein n=1 Tax=Xanthomonas TaxID=338 RepID=UPI000A82C93C|nr:MULTISPECIES: DUF1441 family protein [Xanthomonas]